jgi:hypothetical protein
MKHIDFLCYLIKNTTYMYVEKQAKMHVNINLHLEEITKHLLNI